jgi:CRISP-associated protein Cas1
VLLRGAREAAGPEDQALLAQAAEQLASSIRQLGVADNLDTVRGIEGEAAKNYFAALNYLIRPEARAHFQMNGRTRRPPRDRLNALLSFLYAILMNECRSALETVGLDPQLGFYMPSALDVLG